MSIRGNWDKRRVEPFSQFGEIDRRAFLGLSGMGAAAVVLGAGPFTETALARPSFSDYPFSLGVASGDPRPDGVVLWTRLAPRPLAKDGRGGMPDGRVRVRWEVAGDENFARPVQNGTVYARPELAHSVHVEVDGLQPAREYFYRFKAGAEVSPVGRTKTAPALDSSPSRLAFAFASCQMYEHGYFTAYRHMSEEDLDFVFHLGDYIYEYGVAEYTAKSGVVRTHRPETEITTLADYRKRHAQYKTDGDLQAAHAAFPWVVTWDDHEVENNYADEVSEDGIVGPRFLRRRAAAYQAYYEHMPLRRRSVPRGPDMRLYRMLTFGDLARFNVLDTRQYRDDQANDDGIDPPNRETRDPSRTLTGEEQERWLFDSLRNSGATWDVLTQQVFFSQLDFKSGSGELFAMDIWDGYAGQRDRILDFIAENDVPNPVILTGDIHTNWANDVKADFDDPDSRTVATEYVGTSITSDGNGSDTTIYGSPIARANPHIKFYNDQRGYVSCTVTPEEWRTDYRMVEYVNRPGAPVTTLATFVTEEGNPGAQKVAGTAATTRASAEEVQRRRIQAQQEAGK